MEALVGLLTVLSAGLALSTLTSRGLWVDEAFTKAVAMTPSSRLVDDLSYNGGNMSLYLMFMRGWLVFGDSDWWLRLPSVAFAGACVPAFYALARRIVTTRAAAAGSALVALSPPLMYQAQDARSYPLATLLVILSWLAVSKLAENPTKAARRWYIGLAAAVIYSHLIGVLFVAAQLLWVVAARRRATIVAGIWISVLALPQMVMALRPGANEPSWIMPTTAWALRETLRHLSGTQSYLAAGLVGCFWVYGIVVAHRRGDHESALPIVWLVMPTVGLLTISIVSPMLVPRYLLMVVPGAILLLCLLVDSVPRVGPAIVGFTLLLTLPSLHAGLHRTGPDWKSPTEILIDHAQADEAILFSNSRHLIAHYWDQAGRPRSVPIPLSEPRDWAAMQRTYPLDVDEAIRALDGLSGAWVVGRVGISDSDKEIVSAMAERWPLTDSWTLSGGTIAMRHYGG